MAQETILEQEEEPYAQHPAPGLGKTGTWLRQELSTLKHPRKLFGKAPWYRKDSTDTISTVSSSVREVLRGDTPPGTPSADIYAPREL